VRHEREELLTGTWPEPPSRPSHRVPLGCRSGSRDLIRVHPPHLPGSHNHRNRNVR
jgi:hypothetical protein